MKKKKPSKKRKQTKLCLRWSERKQKKRVLQHKTKILWKGFWLRKQRDNKRQKKIKMFKGRVCKKRKKQKKNNQIDENLEKKKKKKEKRRKNRYWRKRTKKGQCSKTREIKKRKLFFYNKKRKANMQRHVNFLFKEKLTKKWKDKKRRSFQIRVLERGHTQRKQKERKGKHMW